MHGQEIMGDLPVGDEAQFLFSAMARDLERHASG